MHNRTTYVGITTILFDCFEVLMRGLYSPSQKLLDTIGVTLDEFRNNINAPTIADFYKLAMRGDLEEHVYLNFLILHSGWTIPVGQLSELIRESLLKDLEDNAIDIAKTLGNKYQLVLVSDQIPEWKQHIAAHRPISGLFEREFYSSDMHRLKTDPATFSEVLARLGRPGSSCLFIDDQPENTRRAREVGIHTIDYKGTSDLRFQLLKYGIIA